MSAPLHATYFADPHVLRLDDETYVAYGTGRPPVTGLAVFEALVSQDLTSWSAVGPVMQRLPDEMGDEYWAPEVVEADGAWWLYYSVGRGIEGHHIRVARADHPLGPFIDQGVNLTPDETFAIDAHPFRDEDGSWYLFYARDVLDHPRPGTHLAVVRMATMITTEGPVTEVLAPNADWQIFQRQRRMYGKTLDWHTLEGPAVVRRHGRYWITYSGGAWTGPGYAVKWAVADAPTGPWNHAPLDSSPLLSTATTGLPGPGHNSLTTTPDGRDAIVFHAWDEARDSRLMRARLIAFGPDSPVVEQEIVSQPTQLITAAAVPSKKL